MGEIVHRHYEPATSLVELQPDETALQRMIANIEIVRKLVKSTMVKDVDYGTIPGTTKPVLYKAGAEKIGILFGLLCEPDYSENPLPDEHLEVTCRVRIIHRASGAVVGYGVGSASSLESKHLYRTTKPPCPECGADTIRRDTKGDRGWYCWAKIGGCGAQFGPDDERLVRGDVGKTENEDPSDVHNNVRKIAYKRGMVHGIINSTGCGHLFDQDLGKDPADRARKTQEEQQKPPMPTAASERPVRQERQVDASDYGGTPDMQPRTQAAVAPPPTSGPPTRTAGDDWRDSPISEPQAKRMFALEKKHGVSHEAVRQYMREQFNIDTSNQLLRGNYDQVCAWIESHQPQPPK